jgi:hypothetical protein
MANTNFKTWLGSAALSGANSQQNTYNGIINGFSAGGQIKAGDFNAALRMTTLVCAGIAAACGFDTSTIDASEDTIKNALTAKLITPCSNLLAVLDSGENTYKVEHALEADMAFGLDTKEVIVPKDTSGTSATITFKSKTSGYSVNIKVDKIETNSIGGSTLTGNFYDLTASTFTTYNFTQKISSISGKWITSTNGVLNFSGKSYGMYLILFNHQYILSCILPSGGQGHTYINLQPQPTSVAATEGVIRLVLVNNNGSISQLKLQEYYYGAGDTSDITNKNFSILQLNTIMGV